ncbi:MAG TPA: hypothetical protein DCX03_10930 [Bacteroidales bacterium]|nr:hypothetical protein [Bacteroidales bacterium]
MFSTSAIPKRRTIQIALIILILLLTFALIIVWITPATGYEASIYNSTPPILWICLIPSMVVGISLVVVSASGYDLGSTGFWKVGFLLAFLCYVISVSLFIIRGYYMWCMSGDPASHIGWVKEILNAGHISDTLFYPIMHIYLSEVILITNLDLTFLHKVTPLVFDILNVIFMCCLVRAITPNRIVLVLAAVISCIPIYECGWYVNLSPNILLNLFFPLVLFLIFQFLNQNKPSWGILLGFMVILLPVFHPIPTIFLALVLLTLWIPAKLSYLWFALQKKKIRLNFTKPDFKLVLPSLGLLIWFIFWLSSFFMWSRTIKSMYQTICSEGAQSQATNLMSSISYAQGYGYNVVEQVLKQMGIPMVLFALSVLSFPLLWRTFSKNQELKYIFSLYGPFGVVCAAIPALFLFNLPFGPQRFVTHASMLGIVFAAYFLSYLLIEVKKSNSRFKSLCVTLFVILLLAGMFLLGLLNLYPSPYNLTLNYQTTHSEVLGMEHYYENRDVDIPISGITVAPGRFADAFLTPDEKMIQNLPMYLKDQNLVVPWHFGYDSFVSISSVYDEETDLLITMRDKIIYTDYFPDMAQYRFNSQDFERLNEDPEVSLLYSNGGFDF